MVDVKRYCTILIFPFFCASQREVYKDDEKGRPVPTEPSEVADWGTTRGNVVVSNT